MTTFRLSETVLLDATNIGLAGVLKESSDSGDNWSKKRTKKEKPSLDTGHGCSQTTLLSEVQFEETTRLSILTTAGSGNSDIAEPSRCMNVTLAFKIVKFRTSA